MTLNYPYQNIAKVFFGFVLLMALYFIYKAALPPLTFDDAYMFTRYAKNILINHNFGWNAGERTYGCTSIAYTLFITVVELFVPKSFANDEIILKFSSCFWGIIALVFIYKSLKILIKNSILKKLYLSELTILIILFMPVFTFNLFNGMDTTMSLFGNSLMIFLFLKYLEKQSLLSLVSAALSSYLIFFIRPDNGLCMMIFPALVLWNTKQKIKPFIITYSIIILCLIIDAAVKYLYFGYIIPLPFYVKSFGLYDSYLGISKWNATPYLRDIFMPFFTLLVLYILFIKKSAIVKTLVYWLPLLCTYIYFFSIVQVMGMDSRYYLPFIPFFIAGFATGLNHSAYSNFNFSNIQITGFKKRFVMLLLVIPGADIFGYFSDTYYSKLDSAITDEAKKYSVNNSVYTADSLPEIEWWHSILIFDSLMKRVPVTTLVAASEDGFIGSNNMQMQVMDLSQLHNNDVLKKMSLLSSIEKTKPDIIWLPHTDYTKERYEIFHSVQLLNEYDFYSSVLNYGIAIKKTYPEYSDVISYFENLYKIKLGK